MAKATNKVMENLHSALAETLAKFVKTTVDPETGAAVPPQASILNVARQFLKDNHIEGLPVEDSPLANLVDSLPFAGTEDDSEHDMRH